MPNLFNIPKSRNFLGIVKWAATDALPQSGYACRPSCTVTYPGVFSLIYGNEEGDVCITNTGGVATGRAGTGSKGEL